MDLAAYVETELEQNPMLERDEGISVGREEGGPQEDVAQGDVSRTDSADLLSPDAMPGAGAESPLDTDYSNNYDGEIAGPGVEPGGAYPAAALIFPDGGRMKTCLTWKRRSAAVVP